MEKLSPGYKKLSYLSKQKNGGEHPSSVCDECLLFRVNKMLLIGKGGRGGRGLVAKHGCGWSNSGSKLLDQRVITLQTTALKSRNKHLLIFLWVSTVNNPAAASPLIKPAAHMSVDLCYSTHGTVLLEDGECKTVWSFDSQHIRFHWETSASPSVEHQWAAIISREHKPPTSHCFHHHIVRITIL